MSVCYIAIIASIEMQHMSLVSLFEMRKANCSFYNLVLRTVLVIVLL